MITIVYCLILPPTSLYQRKKTKQPLFHLGISRNVNNFYKIVDIFQTFLIFFSTKNGKLRWSIIFMSMQFYSF
jgi:hypothetical protein